MKVVKFIVKKRKVNNMKDIIIISLTLVLIVGGGIWTHNYYEETRDGLEEKLNSLSESIGLETNKKAKVEEIENFWKSKEDILIIFQEHDAIDEIEEHLCECIHYFKIEDEEQFELSKILLLKRMEDLVKREHLKIVNLF